MKAYSLDLRQKVVDAYAIGDISQRKLAKAFGVTAGFVQNLLKRQREQGTIAPKVRTEQTPTKLNADQLEILRQLVEAQPDATLAELRERLHEKTQVLIGVATVDRMVRLKLNLNFKKKVSTRRRKAPMKSNYSDLNTGNSYKASRSKI
jgi:transposase